ncbi:hypothetical protein QJQ45_021677, partial [Haematococcus lacustris]
PEGVCQGVVGAIGNTPLIRIASLSDATGCEVGRGGAAHSTSTCKEPSALSAWVQILGKAEMLNPGGSVKDRVALQIVTEAMAEGRLLPGGLITEGTAGSTGVSLAMVAAAVGCHCFIAMPDDAAIEKVQVLQALGAEVQRVRPVSITHPEHHVNVARRKALAVQAAAEAAATSTPSASPSTPPCASSAIPTSHFSSAIFADQFENLANQRAHFVTGAEIWAQTHGRLHAFVSGAGTGGTLAGVSCILKARNPGIKVFLIDPPGSSLYNKVSSGGPGGAGWGVVRGTGKQWGPWEESDESEGNSSKKTGQADLDIITIITINTITITTTTVTTITTTTTTTNTTITTTTITTTVTTTTTTTIIPITTKHNRPALLQHTASQTEHALLPRWLQVERGVLYARVEAEGTRLRHPFDTITEGIGINRLTLNFQQAAVDAAFTGAGDEGGGRWPGPCEMLGISLDRNGSDREAVEMAAYLLRNDGLFVGSAGSKDVKLGACTNESACYFALRSSAAMNCVGAVKAARRLGPGHTVVTILCDGGARHLSKFHNPEYLRQMGLLPCHSAPHPAVLACLLGLLSRSSSSETSAVKAGSIDDAAAALLGIDSDKVRCMQVPHIEKKLGFTLHFYFDLQGVEHGLPHNTNATQLYLIASLPDEPPDVVPASIHGPVLLSATDFKTEEYIDMTLGHWDQLKSMCLDVQPNAQ